MKAALLIAHHSPLELAKLTPELLSYGQVLVKVLASGICGAQLQEIDGHKIGGPLPHPLGHEGCGIVVEVGPAVRQVKVGEKVVMHWRKGDGIESEFPRYKYEYYKDFYDRIDTESGMLTSGKITTFSDYSVCSENRLTPVPMDTPVELCALLGCGLSTALGTIESEANLKMGERVLIIGCGGLGLNLILAAKMRMAGFIVAIERIPKKSEAAHAMGAHSARPGFWLMENEKYDIIIDTTGDEGAIEEGLKFLAPSGRFVMVGQPRPGVAVRIENARHLFDGEGCSIKATQGGMFRPSVDIPRYVRLHESGQLNLTGIITHRVPLSDINRGIDLVRNGEAGRVLIEP